MEQSITSPSSSLVFSLVVFNLLLMLSSYIVISDTVVFTSRSSLLFYVISYFFPQCDSIFFKYLYIVIKPVLMSLDANSIISVIAGSLSSF